jgi:hypothetical protein
MDATAESLWNRRRKIKNKKKKCIHFL